MHVMVIDTWRNVKLLPTNPIPAAGDPFYEMDKLLHKVQGIDRAHLEIRCDSDFLELCKRQAMIDPQIVFLPADMGHVGASSFRGIPFRVSDAA